MICSERAATYDKENRFFQEDFDELKEAGYLLMSVPEEFGGYGLNLADSSEITRKLAYHAAPTALALNMHVYWAGLVSDLWRQGDKSLEWLLKEAGNGKVFAAGHSESGNDHPVLYSTTEAKKVDGGYTFTGHKIGIPSGFGESNPKKCHLCPWTSLLPMSPTTHLRNQEQTRDTPSLEGMSQLAILVLTPRNAAESPRK